MRADDVLHTPMPEFAADEVIEAVGDQFGVRPKPRSTALPSERDQLLLLPDTDVGPIVVKVSNAAESPRALDFESQALQHLAEVDPDLPVPRLHATGPGGLIGSIVDKDGREHALRVMTALPGSHVEGRVVTPRLAESIGALCARVSIGLRGFFHEYAGRPVAWDIRVQRAPAPDPLAAARTRIKQAVVATRSLPSGVQHADLTLTNVLVDDAGAITGVVDLGDMHHTAAVCDVAVALTSVLRNTATRQVASVWELAGAFLDGYQRWRPLLPEEAAVLGHLVLARLLTTLDISRERVDEHPANRTYISQYDASTQRLLATLLDLSDDELSRRFSRLTGLTIRRESAGEPLARRRDRVLGGGLAPTFYTEPVHIAAGEGPWLVSDEGEHYLDAYNNVAVAGHTHPAITQAVVRQLRTLNTNNRYLHPAIVELAERLGTTMPDGLDTCVFVTSGSEANDLAWRLARAYTGESGTVVAEWSYHGISARTEDFSTMEWTDPGRPPPDVATFTAPHGAGSPLDRDEARGRVAAAVDDLARRGARPGVLMVDPQFTSEGILDAPAEFMQGLVTGVHDAGGLFLADEVQSGFGRSGPQLWRFATMGITPDIVTLGKPMAAGLPVAAVVTRREIADAFARNREYFSTFAGSPVAAVACLAVLDVLSDRGLPERAVRVGAYLRERLREVQGEFPVVAEVRGYGLIAGVDLRPSEYGGGREFTAAVIEGLRRHRVLAGRTGRGGHVLKVRPPLVWEEEHADRFTAALRLALRDTARS